MLEALEVIRDLSASAKLLHDLYRLSRAGEIMPRLTDLAKMCGAFDAHAVDSILRGLEKQREIRRWHGTRSQYRGHQSILLLETGKRLRTEGCPEGFDPIDPHPGRAAK